MQDFIKQSGFVILALLVLVIIKQIKADMQIPIKLVVSVVLFGVLVMSIGGFMGEIQSLLSHAGISKYATIMLKALFVGIITSICSSLCADAGEGTLSFICVMLGKVQILFLALPLIFEILNLAIKLTSGE